MAKFYFDGATQLSQTTLTIASGQTTSDAIDLGSMGLVGFLMPSAFTGTSITFTGAFSDSDTYTALYNADNNAFSITVAVDRYYMLNPADFIGTRFVKFVSGSSEGAERTLKVITRSFA